MSPYEIMQSFKGIFAPHERWIVYTLLAVSTFSFIITLWSKNRLAKLHRRDTSYVYLAGLWNQILDACLAHPQFMDVVKTEHFHQQMEKEELLKYDAFCYKLWSHVEDIVSRGFHDDPQFKPIIHWVTDYHYDWLVRNPTYFSIHAFWECVQEARDSPSLLFRYRNLPVKGGDVDWDIISKDYHSYVLSPFAPSMTIADSQGGVRNKALQILRHIVKGLPSGAKLADFGCGPGNLIPHLSGMNLVAHGIDKSAGALVVCETLASKHAVEFVGIQKDMRDLGEIGIYDLAFSSNSIIPENRDDVARILMNIRSSLKQGSPFVAIMPSFDTTLYLRDLWRKAYIRKFGNEEQADRIMHAFTIAKKVNEIEFSFADDGRTSQCYHTPDTIKDEFKKAGFEIVQPIEKIYYPWGAYSAV